MRGVSSDLRMGEPLPRDMDPVITDYYDRAPEEARLEQGPFQLEAARTRELIQRFVGDAALLGFTLPELIDQLRNEEKK